MRDSATSLALHFEEAVEELTGMQMPDPDDPDEVLDALQRWTGKILAILVILVKLMTLVGIEAARER